MHPTQLGMSLLLLAALAACGDASSPDGEGTQQAGPATSALPDPSDVLAALPPEAQPYGLDVYTAKCASCHGDLGQGVGNHPALRGLTPPAMQQRLLDYRSGKTLGAQTAVMAQAVAGLGDAEIAAVSIYAGE
jgi:mono/diheme cytochrome c family protein